jgi:mono/diheme cytochrome c family protein/glucose/arabinose dehydrogenase
VNTALGWSIITHTRTALFIGVALVSLAACRDEGPSPPKTPEEELATFSIEPGLHIELVAAEPLVQDPVVITFDADGRLWVVEMRGFMPDIDGAGEGEPVGRVSVLEDRDGDGLMETGTVYIDSLILPRALAVVPGGALLAENQALWLTRDTNGDLRADEKILIDSTYAGGALVEHSGNGLWRGVDNWYYNAKSRLRYRLVDGQWRRDNTEFRGQWGISHDDAGRLYYNYNWSQLHADLVPPNYLSRNPNHKPTSGIDHGLTLDRRVYPIRDNPAVNRGYIPGTLDQQGRLLEFTAACSPLYYRGDALPQAFYGNVFVCEPSGNLIKRNVVISEGWDIGAYDPHPGTEFLASTDERFRPVFLAIGPDGALYVADMYRGLIQHGAHVTPYLREQTLTRKLVLPIHYGRIWRIVPEGWHRPSTPAMSDASSTQLVEWLSDRNGWRRDMAQMLLITRGDTSVVDDLESVVQRGANPLGRFHALWTLEGLGMLRADLLFDALRDDDSQVRVSALRLIEPFAKNDPNARQRLTHALKEMVTKGNAEFIPQVAFAASALPPSASHRILTDIAVRYDTSALIRDAVLSSLYGQEFSFMQRLMQSRSWNTSSPARQIFLEMICAAVLKHSNADEIRSLLKMVSDGSDLAGWQRHAVATAIKVHAGTGADDPIDLPAEPESITKNPSDTALADAVTRLFRWPGHQGRATTAVSSELSPRDQQLFAEGRQRYLTTCSGCHGTDGAGLARFGPSLVGSEWVLGDKRRLALLLLHGMEGPIEVNGKVMDVPDILPVMPAHSVLGDREITAIMTYIRNEWGNHAGPVSPRTVGTIRHTTQGRVVPWTAEDLNRHMQQLDEAQ